MQLPCTIKLCHDHRRFVRNRFAFVEISYFILKNIIDLEKYDQ